MMSMLHESEEDGVEGILSVYDTYTFRLEHLLPSSRGCMIGYTVEHAVVLCSAESYGMF